MADAVASFANVAMAGIVATGKRGRRGFEKFGSDLPAMRAEDFRERLRAARAAVERDAPRLADGNFADDQEAAHALLGSDGQPGQNREPDASADDALILDGGDDSDGGGAGAQRR